jgi:hypothetical protein
MKIFRMMVVLIAAVTAAGQDALRIGEQVEYSCSRVSNGWCGGKVEAVNGSSVRIRWGNMRDQATVVNRDQVRVPPKPDSPETTAFKEAFAAEVGTQQRNALRIFAHYYSDEFSYAGGTPTTPAGWQELMARMAEVDALCKGKYRGMSNRTPSVAWTGPKKGDLDARYGEWCKIADQRLVLEPQVRAGAAKYMIGLTQIIDINKAIEHSRNLTWDETQMILYEPEKWKAKTAAELKPSFANYGTAMPADFFNEIDAKAAELRSIIDRTAPTKIFDRPSHRDVAVEKVVLGKFAAKFPGSHVVSIGGSYPSWEKREGADLIRSDTDAKVYRLTVNYYKRGYALVKIPNRPYCQARSWIVRQRGMAVDLGEGGEFMKCQ